VPEVVAARLGHALTQADVVISSTGAPHRIVRRDRLEQAVADRRPGRAPLLLIDLAGPRDVDPAVVGLAGSSPRGAASTGARSLRLRAYGYLERDVSA
jgi:glutamyl-tRNA reductase